MYEARGTAIAPNGLAYIADYRNNRIDVFSLDGSFVRTFGKGVEIFGGSVCTATDQCISGSAGNGAGAMNRPADVAINSAGEVFVADEANHRIDVYSSEGVFMRAFGKAVSLTGSPSDICTAASGCRSGEEGDSGGALIAPTGVGIDSAGRVFVANTGNNRIDVFSSKGEFVFAFGEHIGPSGADVCLPGDDCEGSEGDSQAGAMEGPYDVAVDSGGQVAVTDPGNHRIDVFSSSGGFVRSFGKGVSPGGADVCTAATGCTRGQETGAAGALDFPSAVAVGGSKDLYVADAQNNRIAEFSSDGSFLRAFGEGVFSGQHVFEVCTTATGCTTGYAGANAGAVSSPFGVAVDCAGSVYATEWYMSSLVARVERFGETGAPFPPCPDPEPEPEPESEPESEPPPPSGQLPGSSSPSGSTTPLQPPVPGSHGLAKPSFKVELNKWDGTATLSIAVSEPGTLLLRGKNVRKVGRQAKRIGLVELLVQATGKAKRKLRKAGKAKVKVSFTFTAEWGGSNTQATPITLKLAPPLL